MSKLLLISSSRVHGSEFLEHCRSGIAEHFKGIKRVLFIPYALADQDRYRDLVAEAFSVMDITIESIHDADDPIQAVDNAAGIFVGGGNTFRLLKTLYDLALMDPIRNAVQRRGVPYMGSSAGTNIACPTIRTTNDMPIVEPPSFESLGLFPWQINPHFIDADPNSTHKGETREQRIAEFHEENEIPVLGIREGSWIVVNDQQRSLQGTTGMKMFRRGQKPTEVAAGPF
ncbi:MAG: dipeptidase PepE [Planctomycetota bacterium]